MIPPTLSLIEEGDWDCHNCLKVYSSLHLSKYIKNEKCGGELNALSTFTASELLSYNNFIVLTIIANTLSLKRVNLKKRVSVQQWLTMLICLGVIDHGSP